MIQRTSRSVHVDETTFIASKQAGLHILSLICWFMFYIFSVGTADCHVGRPLLMAGFFDSLFILRLGLAYRLFTSLFHLYIP
jgi:hypothetical protein